MRRRRVILVLVLVPGLALLTLVLFTLATADTINRGSFERLKIGMTDVEAEAILGKPRDTSDQRQRELVRMKTNGVGGGLTSWRTNYVGIVVRYDENKKVIGTDLYGEHSTEPESFSEKIRRWLGGIF